MIILQEAIGAAILLLNLFILSFLIGVPFLTAILFKRFKKQHEELNGSKQPKGEKFFTLLLSVIISIVVVAILCFLFVLVMGKLLGPLD